jgi:hypothetical protein
MLQAIGITKEMQDSLQPIVTDMDKYGSHGLSVSQLLRKVVRAKFVQAPSRD